MKLLQWLKGVFCKSANQIDLTDSRHDTCECECECEYECENEYVTQRNAKSISSDMLKRVDRLNQKMSSIVDLL